LKLRAVIAVLASAVLLTGCSTNGKLAGSAAVFNDQTIPMSEVTKQVNEARMQIERTDPASISKVPTLTEISQRVVERLILVNILTEATKRENINISKSDVATFRDSVFAQYGKDKIEAQLVSQNGVSASHVDEFIYLIMVQQAIMRKLAPVADQTTQTKTLYDFLSAVSKDLGTRLNPRYGTWDPKNLSSVPGDLVLSAPAAPAAPAAQ